VLSEQTKDAETLAVARFRFALRRFERRTDSLVRGCGLTPQRYLLLLAVRSTRATGGRATVSTIAHDLQMPQTTVTDLVARAVAAGLVVRHAEPADGRVAQLVLTTEGGRRLARAIAALNGARGELRRALIEASRLFPA
jgi:DNA-binding MarR family transcriptional regulator